MIFILQFRHFSRTFQRLYSKSSQHNLIQLLNKMPKEPKHITEAQKQRKKIKEKFSKYVPGKVTLQVLGTGAKGAPTALYIFSDQSRYLFNCGEGTQRLAHEHKMKLSKLEHIFITQPTWKNIGGLPGTALTIQDVGVPHVTLHGPPGLEELFQATSRFVIIRDLRIQMAICNESNHFEDNVMKVSYVPLTRQSSETIIKMESNDQEESEDDDVDYYAYEGAPKKPLEKKSKESRKSLQETKESGVSMCYICQLQPRPGALNLDLCVKKGVPPGPLLGKLKSGETITLVNGTQVTSKEVCEPDDPGPIFLVIDCPSELYLDSLLSNESLAKHQATARNDSDIADIIVHFTPINIMNTEKYKLWMSKFSLSTRHLVLNEGNSCMGSLSVHRIQHKLNMLSQDMFPLLKDNGTKTYSGSNNEDVDEREKFKFPQTVTIGSETSSFGPVILADTFCSYSLRPKTGLNSSNELILNPEEFRNEALSIESFPQTLEELKEKLQNADVTETPGFPKILFLGTGSCIPNKTRNTSGILMETKENTYVLLDCGEGTFGQLVRFFGRGADQVLANINAVYISHLHADHHIGLIGLLQGRRKARQNLGLPSNPFILFAPKQIMFWLNFYDRCFEPIKEDFLLAQNADLLSNNESRTTLLNFIDLEELGFKNIETCFVKHCPNAFGLSITLSNGKKIVYSGDTMPSTSLVDLGRNCDILIHEATMEDDLGHEAIVKMHSTTSQAINIGKQMEAKHVLLTHFSQRYAKLPRFNENFASNVSIAFDNMQVTLRDLEIVPLLYPALKLMFAEHYEELEQKALKRQLKQEREDRQKESVREKQRKLEVS